MALITYKDKISLVENQDIADENKVTAQDMNEIKKVVNENQSLTYDSLPVGSVIDFDGDTVPTGYKKVADPNVYSTEEKRVGTWFGKPLYEITILYSNSITSSTEINHNISNIEEIWLDMANSYLKKSTGNIGPTSYYANSSDYGATFVNTEKFVFPGANFANIIGGTFSLRYTKTKDTVEEV